MRDLFIPGRVGVNGSLLGTMSNPHQFERDLVSQALSRGAPSAGGDSAWRRADSGWKKCCLDEKA
jgi:hypothetical protein